MAIALTLVSMSASMAAPVALGLAIGIGFMAVFSLALTGIPKEPTMFLITNDGKSYKAYDNVYCGQACDFLAYARVVPSDPPIQISKESDLVLRTGNPVGQPKAMHFIFQS